MKTKTGMPRKAALPLKSLKLAKQTPTLHKTENLGGNQKSQEHIKPNSPEVGGNFSFFREKVRNGGSSDDLKWILDLRHSKKMPKPEK